MISCFIVLLSTVGPRQDHMAARSFIQNMFIKVAPPHSVHRIYTHFCATDSESIKRTFANLRACILLDHIRDVIPEL